MTKAKTAKKEAEVERKMDKATTKAKTEKAPAKAKDTKASAPVPSRMEPKAVVPAAKTSVAEKEKPPVKEAPKAREREEEKPAKNSGKVATKPAKPDERPAVEAPARPAAKAEPYPEPRPVSGFANFGLGVKVASKKPVLSVAPGVMILGRQVTTKPDAAAKPLERKLSKKELADIKAILIEKRERLLAGMRRELAMQRERAESKAADEVDKATDAYDEDLSFEIATANDQELEEIQVALEKIERSTYGECELCSTNISPSRLKILPSATTCVSCRGQEEMARRRDDSPNFNMMAGEDGESESGEG